MTGQEQKKAIRVLIADDHALILDGVRSLLGQESDIEVVATAEDGEQAVLLAKELKPDVILMDIRMPKLNGIEATRQIKAQQPEIIVLCMSVHHETIIVDSIMEAGASGYIIKGNAGAALAGAIRIVFGGELYFCSTITDERARNQTH